FGTVGAPLPVDTDGDGALDYRDLDSDGDGIFDIHESTHFSLDADLDGMIDATADKDGDGVCDVADDSDLDGYPDSVDPDPAAFGGIYDTRVDTDGDGTPDFQDFDSDDDSVGDDTDNCRTVV